MLFSGVLHLHQCPWLWLGTTGSKNWALWHSTSNSWFIGMISIIIFPCNLFETFYLYSSLFSDPKNPQAYGVEFHGVTLWKAFGKSKYIASNSLFSLRMCPCSGSRSDRKELPFLKPCGPGFILFPWSRYWTIFLTLQISFLRCWCHWSAVLRLAFVDTGRPFPSFSEQGMISLSQEFLQRSTLNYIDYINQ